MDKKLVNEIRKKDGSFLKALYSMRVLSADMISDHFYSNSRRINKLLKLGFISHKSWDELHYYELKQPGLTFIRKYYDYWGYKKLHLSQVLTYDRNLRHQLALNRFVFNAVEISRGKFSYYDQKLMPMQGVHIIPDGIIETDEAVYLLEMDMSTEHAKALAKKWEKYRVFLSYNWIDLFHSKPLICLFIIENAHNLDGRRALVMKTVAENILDMLGHDFNFYIDSADLLLKHFFKTEDSCIAEENLRILLSELGFEIYPNPNFSKNHKYYIRRFGKEIESGCFKEALLDIYSEENALIFRNIYYFESDQGKIFFETGKNLPYVIIVNSFESICRMLNLLNQRVPDKVHFTTLDLLKENAFEDALFYAEFNELKNEYSMKPAGDISETVLTQ